VLPVPPETIVPTDSEANVSPAAAAGLFAVSADGAGTYSFPIWTPNGRRNIEPSLAVVYNSRLENGTLGIGWSLKGLSLITRCKRDIARDGYNAAIQFTSDDAFCLDGQRLVRAPDVERSAAPHCASGDVTEYRTEEDHFVRILQGPSDDLGPQWFEADLKDGRMFCYGTTADSRLEGQRFHSAPSSLSGTTISRDVCQNVRLSWGLAEVRDRFGNNLTIRYSHWGDPPPKDCRVIEASIPGYEQLPTAIAYTGSLDNSLPAQRTVAFEYESRPDNPTIFVAGLRLQTLHRLSKISLAAPNPVKPSVIKTYNFEYSTSPATGRSLLSTIKECDGSGICLPDTNFVYSYSGPARFLDVDTGIHDDSAGKDGSIGTQLGPFIVGDFNGDGCDDLIFSAWKNIFPGDLAEADYRLSSCYDAIAAGTAPLPAPNPGNLFRLSPSLAGAPDSTVPPVNFNRLSTVPPLCPTTSPGAQGMVCYSQLLAVDLDLDGRSDLFSYIVSENCGYPFPQDCVYSTTWDQDFFTSVFLASAVPPAQWSPFSGIFRVPTNSFAHTSQSKSFFSWDIPDISFYTSTYLGDINGDGFPDLIHLTPNGWSYQLNKGRAQQCIPYAACLNLSKESPFFPAVGPSGPSWNLANVFVTDIYKEGTSDLLLRDPQGNNWYAAYRLSTSKDPRMSPQSCPTGTDYCPLLPPSNLALAAGDTYNTDDSNPGRRDWFVDLNGDSLPDAFSVPSFNLWNVFFPIGNHPFVSVNTGNGFDTPVEVTGVVPLPTSSSSVEYWQGGDNLNIFDYDGNGTQDLIYSNLGQGSRLIGGSIGKPGPSAWAGWLPVHTYGDGKTAILQLLDDRIDSNHQHQLGMNVWAPNQTDTYSQAWGSNDMHQGPGALAWLPVDMQGDGRTEIAQLWNSNGNLGFIVWGPNTDGSYSQVCCAGDTGHQLESKVIKWLPVDMHGDGKTEIVELWDNNNKLGMNVWAPNANYSYSLAWSSSDMGQGSGAVQGGWVPVDMQGDGRTEIAQLWNSSGNLGFIVWAPNADYSYSQVCCAGDTGHQLESKVIEWVPVDMHGDGRTEIVELWDNNNKLGMNVWAPNANYSYSLPWSSSDMGQGSGAVQGGWVKVDMQGDGRTEIAQLWNSGGNLGFIIWAPNADFSFSQVCCAGDTGHQLESEVIEWLPVDMHGDGKTQIVQIWANNSSLDPQFAGLGMNVWSPKPDYSYSAAWSSSDMGSYLYALLTRDSQYRSVPLLDQNGNPIRAGSMGGEVFGRSLQRPGPRIQALDLNGDGLMDLVQILDGDIHVYIRQGKKPDLLENINDRGALISVNYAPLTSGSAYSTTVPPGVISSAGIPDPSSPGHTYVLSRGLWVVSSYTIPRAGSLDQKSGPRNEYRYSYRDGRTDLLGRGWLGFAQMTETDMQTHAVITTSYDNLTMFGSAYPSANKLHIYDKHVALTDNHLFNERVITTTYGINGTSDGKYTVVTPNVVHEQEFEAPAQLSVNVVVQPTWYTANFNLQIDGLTYATDIQSGTSTGPQMQLAGPHNVSEVAGTGTDLSQFAINIAGDCDANGNVTLAPGDSKACTFTNSLRESIICSVFDDPVTLANLAGPSDSIFISGRNNEQGMACVPSGQFGICRKAFGHCHTVGTGEPMYFSLFDDGYSNVVGPTDAVFIQDQNYQGNSGASKACLADGTCRKWFGPALLGDGRAANGFVFDDGPTHTAGPSDAVFIPYPIPGPGEACIPSPTPTATCHRWFGLWNAHKK